MGDRPPIPDRPPGSILVVTGAPGTGKTTVSATLAGSSDRGLHLVSDVFYEFPARPLDPTKPESHAQNETIIRAVGRASAAFAESGYRVVLDGIFGPWFLPTLCEELRGWPTDYAVLRAPRDEALRRVRTRDGPGASAAVAHMHRAFADLGALAAHAVETAGRHATEVAAEIEERGRAGALRLPEGAASPPTGARQDRGVHR